MVLFHASVCVFLFSIQGNYRLVPIGIAIIVACLAVFIIGRLNSWDGGKVGNVGLLDLTETTVTPTAATTQMMTDGSTASDKCKLLWTDGAIPCPGGNQPDISDNLLLLH